MNTAIKLNTPEERQLTYAEWEALHNQRKAHAEARRRAYKARKREEAIYYIKQKIMGLFAIILAILIPFVCDGDATASLIFLPLGIYLLFTHEKVMMFRGYEETDHDV